MATKLEKAVRREVQTASFRSPVIVELSPGGMISFRLKKTRKKFTLTIGWCAIQAMKAQAQADQLARKLERAAKRKERKR